VRLLLQLLLLTTAATAVAAARGPATTAAALAALATMANEDGGLESLPQGISGTLPGWLPEERLLLARLLGHPPHPEAAGPGSAAAATAAASNQPPGRAYWDALDEASRVTTPVKQMFESAWYRCQKLNGRLSDLISADLGGALADHPGRLFEAEALPQMLTWLGIDESLLPGGKSGGGGGGGNQLATYRDLERVLEAVAAAGGGGGEGSGQGGGPAKVARLVPDPVPFLRSSAPASMPVDRNGVPMLVHVTLKVRACSWVWVLFPVGGARARPAHRHRTQKTHAPPQNNKQQDKNAFQRHQLISLASWAKLNPDYALLLYDDDDLRAYILSDDDWFSRIGREEEEEEAANATAAGGWGRDRGRRPLDSAGGGKKKKGGASAADVYARLRTPVERADLWRYMVMCRHGGIYADSDTLVSAATSCAGPAVAPLRREKKAATVPPHAPPLPAPPPNPPKNPTPTKPKQCVRPAQEWNRENEHDAEVLLGVEDVFRRDPLQPGGGSGWGVRRGRWGVQFEQWAMAAAPRQPVFCGMLDLIRARLDDEASSAGGGGGAGGGGEGGGGGAAAAAAFGSGGGAASGKTASSKGAEHAQDWGVLHRTGPHVWTDSVLRWMNLRGVGFHEALLPGGALVRDRPTAAAGVSWSSRSSSSSALSARVMPPEAFGCAAHFFAADTNLEDVHVMHMFRGVWRARRNEEEAGEGEAVGVGVGGAAAAAAGR
jgi:hypothetical protein